MVVEGIDLDKRLASKTKASNGLKPKNLFADGACRAGADRDATLR
jgi:hypothetical protein